VLHSRCFFDDICYVFHNVVSEGFCFLYLIYIFNVSIFYIFFWIIDAYRTRLMSHIFFVFGKHYVPSRLHPMFIWNNFVIFWDDRTVCCALRFISYFKSPSYLCIAAIKIIIRFYIYSHINDIVFARSSPQKILIILHLRLRVHNQIAFRKRSRENLWVLVEMDKMIEKIILFGCVGELILWKSKEKKSAMQITVLCFFVPSLFILWVERST